ncbi:MAG: sigma-70 family RNA polymerase sigma factor [Pirellulales bacterium]
MHLDPETRRSLLLRIRDRDDARAWEEFVEIYEPLLYRLVREKGLQHADAQELTQEALLAVASAIERWDPDREKGSFRGWLFCIARNMTINFLTRRRTDQQGGGGTDFRLALEQHPDPTSELTAAFEQEYERELFDWAARQVRGEFHESTWQAFWRTAVEGEPIPETATALGLSLGAVYMARTRVMARIKARVKEVEIAQEDQP